jgi:hypothetical protein
MIANLEFHTQSQNTLIIKVNITYAGINMIIYYKQTCYVFQAQGKWDSVVHKGMKSYIQVNTKYSCLAAIFKNDTWLIKEIIISILKPISWNT